jgi:molybdate transport system substrate-binding protein
VRATLAAVEAGAVDAGIVYRTDAAISRRVRVAYEIPSTEGPRITYPVAALADRPGLDAARRVVACFAGPGARPVFERFGFAVLGPAP